MLLNFQQNVGARIENILPIVLKIQVDCTCFDRGKAATNFGGNMQ